MPYHSASRLIAYSPEQGMLKTYLEQGFDPYDYSYELEQWLEDHVCEECDTGDDPDCDKCSGALRAKVDKITGGDDSTAWIDTASDADLARFREWAEQQISSSTGPDRPVYEHMSYERLVKPTWLVHFTDDPEKIASDGFKYGWESLEGLGLTTHFTDKARKRGPGFNFAFTIGSRDAKNAARGHHRDGSKYGKHAVVFWAGGVEAYHYGDEENQVVFWGPEVQPSRIFAIWNDGDNSWYVYDAVERVVFGMPPDDYDNQGTVKSFEEAAEWVVDNYRMLSRTEEKVERIRQQTPPRRRGVPD